MILEREQPPPFTEEQKAQKWREYFGNDSGKAPPVKLSIHEMLRIFRMRDRLRLEASITLEKTEALRAEMPAMPFRAGQLETVDGQKWVIPPYGSKRSQTVTCQRENFSPKTSNSTSYRRKRAFEVEINCENGAWMHGIKLARAYGMERPGKDEAMKLAMAHALEFTVTIPKTAKSDSAKYFSKVWDNFNRHYFINADWVDSWLMVKEPHKSGNLHAHLLVLTKPGFSVDHPAKKARWYKNKFGKTVVIGSTISEWIPKLWAEFRGGLLNKWGLGSIHSLQPIRSREKFGKYIAKYLIKGFKEDRPEHLKGVRLVAYSYDFARSCRVYGYKPAGAGLDHKTRIHYIDGKGNPAKRYEMAGSFDFAGPVGRYRRKRISELAKMLGIQDIDGFENLIGKKWAYYLEKLIVLDDSGPWDHTEFEDITDLAGNSVTQYRLSLIDAETCLRPLITDGDNEIEFRDWQKLPDETPEQREFKEKFEFMYCFRDHASGAIIEFDQHRKYIEQFRAWAWIKLFQRKKQFQEMGEMNKCAVIDRELMPI